jgi:hypothetical protein
MARIGTRISNVSDVRPDRRGKLEARAIGLGDGRMLSVGTSIDIEGDLPGGIAAIAMPPESTHGILLIQPVDVSTGELVQEVAIAAAEVIPVVDESPAAEEVVEEEETEGDAEGETEDAEEAPASTAGKKGRNKRNRAR